MFWGRLLLSSSWTPATSCCPRRCRIIKASFSPPAWHIAELKSIMNCDRAIKKTNGQSPPWVWLALCPPRGPSLPTKACPLAAPAGHGALTRGCVFPECACSCLRMCVCEAVYSCDDSIRGVWLGGTFKHRVNWVWPVRRLHSRPVTPVGWRPGWDSNRHKSPHSQTGSLGFMLEDKRWGTMGGWRHDGWQGRARRQECSQLSGRNL